MDLQCDGLELTEQDESCCLMDNFIDCPSLEEVGKGTCLDHSQGTASKTTNRAISCCKFQVILSNFLLVMYGNDYNAWSYQTSSTYEDWAFYQPNFAIDRVRELRVTSRQMN